MKLAINGAGVRMGTTVGRLALAAGDIDIVAAIEHAKSPLLGTDYGRHLGGKDSGLKVAERLSKKADAMIDFSTPGASIDRLDECVKLGTPAVLCTTGFEPAQLKKIEAAAKKVPVLLSSNMSVGVNLLFRIAPEIAKTLGPDYDIEIVETHHRRKKDSPSGTAVTLAERIAEGLGRKYPEGFVFGRQGLVGERPKGEIGVHAVRGGDVVGEHRILFATEGETIEITHRASTRDLFAHGALRAARFVANAKPGRYSMIDALK